MINLAVINLAVNGYLIDRYVELMGEVQGSILPRPRL